jgi:uncharacterized protein (TIGR02118 family)
MSKVIFVLQRRSDRTLDEVRKQWSDETHVSHVRNLPGLTKFIQNYVVASPGGHVCDGMGELWFENDEAMEKALNSPEMGAAVESAKNFLDMDKTGMIVVQEATVIS